MRVGMDEDIKRWTARRKAAVVREIIQGKTTVSEVSRQFDLTPPEIEEWVDQGKSGMENALKAKPDDVREQYERQFKELPSVAQRPDEGRATDLYPMWGGRDGWLTLPLVMG